MNGKTKKFDKYFYGLFFSLTGVIILQNLLTYSVNLADNIMIGRYSETSMNGVSLANQIQFLLQMFAMGSANGMSVLTSQYWGEKNIKNIKKIYSSANLIGIFLSLVLAVLVITMPNQILSLLTDKQDAIAEGSKYIVIMGYTYCIYTFTQILLGLLRSVETASVGFFCSACSLVTNIFLNYALIFGHFGAKEMGVEGAAYATFVSRVLELVITCVYVFFIDKKIKLKIKDIFSVSGQFTKDYLKSGFPLVCSSFSWGMAMLLQTAILGRIDNPYVLGANNIATTVFQVVSVLYNSTSNSSSVIIGKTVGENDIPRVKTYTKRLQIMYIAIGLVSSFLMFIMCNGVISLFNVSKGTQELSRTFIYIICISIIGSSYEAPCLTGIVSGGGQTNFVLFNDLIWMWGIVLPLSFLSAFVFKWPVPVTFFLLKLDQLTKCGVAAIKVNRFKWIKKLTRPE